MQNYTSIEQSKKLLELGLNPETADMHYDHTFAYSVGTMDFVAIGKPYKDGQLACWTIGALLTLMCDHITLNKQVYFLNIMKINTCWCVTYETKTHNCRKFEGELIEAVYNMIFWLLENKII